ncbi:MAG: PAS domain S-box protein, partial [Smithella sp.]
MNGDEQTKEQLLNELAELRRYIAELEKSENKGKRTEKAQPSSENFYKAVFENTKTATAILGEDDTILLANGELEQLTGYTREEVEGKKKWTEFIARKDELEWMKEYRRLRLIDPLSVPQKYEFQIVDRKGRVKDILTTVAKIPGKKQTLTTLLDITEQKRTEEALGKRIVALTQPLDDIKNIAFEDLFNLSELQRLQDVLADSWGVAVLLTHPDGTAITQPSNFTSFCEFIRKSEKGLKNCQNSDAELGRYNPAGPVIHKCLSAGLWGAGASITVAGRHIASWLIGQVRNEAQSEEEILEYAREIGIEEAAFREAFLKVPVMSQEKFEQIAHALFALANQLSAITYQNIQQARFIAERKRAEEALRQSEERFRGIYEESPLGIELYDRNGTLLDINRACLDIFGISDVKALKGVKLFENPNLSEECKAQLRRGENVRVEMPFDFGKVTARNWYETTKRGVIYLDVLITPLKGVSKEADIGYLVHTKDITKRKQVEAALQESEKQVRRKLDAILSPEGDIGALELSDIIDTEKIQKLMDEFFDLTNLPMTITDLNGKVLVGIGWQDICTNFHRVNPESRRLCIESDLELTSNVQVGTFKKYRCKNNMWDIATPIMLGDKCVGNIFMGQFLFDEEKPDYETFRQQARKYGFVEQEYIAALDRVPRWSEKTINKAMSFFTIFAGIIGNLGYSNIKLANALEERKRAEEELQKSEAILHSVFKTTPVGLCIMKDRVFQSVNKAWLDICGYSESDLVGHTPRMLYENEEEYERVGRELFTNLAKRGLTSVQTTHRRKDGSFRDVILAAAPLLQENASLGAIVTVEDITKRKKAEFALRQSEEKYRRLHESITEAFASVDMNGRIVESNRAYQSMLGYSEEELCHLTYSDITPEKWHALEKSIVEEQIVLHGYSNVYEKEYQRKDGSVFPVEISTFLIRDDAGNPVGMWAIVRDITERKKLETELNAARDYLRTVFNNVYDAIFVHDLDGKVIDVNDKMLEMYSISREEAVGLNITRDYSATDESMEELRSNWNKVMSGEHIFTEWKARRPKDGSIFDVEVYLSKLVLSDGDYILANVRDITERKLAEEALKESEKKYNQFFKTSRDCVFITNDGILIDINDAAVELLGYSNREELLQVKVPDLYAEPEAEAKHFRIIAEYGYGKEYPVDFRRKDGSIRHTLVTSAARFDTNGNLIGFQGTVRDVTEQRRNEEELRRYREKLEDLVAERTRELEDKTKNLQEVNTALNVLLKKRDQDKKNLEENFVANIGSM